MEETILECVDCGNHVLAETWCPNCGGELIPLDEENLDLGKPSYEEL